MEGKCQGGPWDGRTLRCSRARLQLESVLPLGLSLTPPQDVGEPNYIAHAFLGEYHWRSDQGNGHWQWQGEHP